MTMFYLCEIDLEVNNEAKEDEVEFEDDATLQEAKKDCDKRGKPAEYAQDVAALED